MPPIDLPIAWLKEVQVILAQSLPNTTVWAFGSRVTGKAKQWSDLDLVLFSNDMDWQGLERIKDRFSESNLPIMVDVSLWSKLPSFLREQIEQQHVPIQDHHSFS